jgi:hypothetical protein
MVQSEILWQNHDQSSPQKSTSQALETGERGDAVFWISQLQGSFVILTNYRQYPFQRLLHGP